MCLVKMIYYKQKNTIKVLAFRNLSGNKSKSNAKPTPAKNDATACAQVQIPIRCIPPPPIKHKNRAKKYRFHIRYFSMNNLAGCQTRNMPQNQDDRACTLSEPITTISRYKVQPK